MKIFKNLFGNKSKIHVDEIAVSKDTLLSESLGIDLFTGTLSAIDSSANLAKNPFDFKYLQIVYVLLGNVCETVILKAKINSGYSCSACNVSNEAGLIGADFGEIELSFKIDKTVTVVRNKAVSIVLQNGNPVMRELSELVRVEKIVGYK